MAKLVTNSTPGMATASSQNRSTVVRNSLLSGSIAGMCSTLICHPFDVVRIKMQSAAFQTDHKRLGPIATLTQTVRTGGIRGAWAGLSLPLAAQAVYKATVFSVNNATQYALIDYHTARLKMQPRQNETYQLSLLDRFCCGCVGGTVNGALFVTPVEYVRNQIITKAKSAPESGPIQIILHSLREHGVLSLWRGMVSTVVRDSVGCGLFFVAMATTQSWLKKSFPQERDTSAFSISTVISGGASGLAFWLWSLPVDTCKTWIQSGKAKNLPHAWRIARQHPSGLAVLFQGWQVAFGRGVPSAGITVTVYSVAYQHLSTQPF